MATLLIVRMALFCRVIFFLIVIEFSHTCIPYVRCIGVRANIHLGGGQTEFCPNGFSGGGGSSGKFSGIHILWGGGGSSRNFPGSIFCGVAEFFPLTAVTDPKFVLFKQVLCFARIMSTLCPNSCRQTARIGGGSCPPCPPSRTPMVRWLCTSAK